LRAKHRLDGDAKDALAKSKYVSHRWTTHLEWFVVLDNRFSWFKPSHVVVTRSSVSVSLKLKAGNEILLLELILREIGLTEFAKRLIQSLTASSKLVFLCYLSQSHKKIPQAQVC
jgi:hypothetical protein